LSRFGLEIAHASSFGDRCEELFLSKQVALQTNNCGSSTMDSAQAKLRQASCRQRPLCVNLLDDLGSSDSFVVDGDSLLLDCFGSSITDTDHSGQMLQLFYLVESFLDSLQKCLNARFCFVFFQEHERLWQGCQTSFFLLARQLLQQHLRQTLKLTVHSSFSTWRSKRWLQFVLRVEQPSLIISFVQTVN